jgi:hypothetical protein
LNGKRLLLGAGFEISFKKHTNVSFFYFCSYRLLWDGISVIYFRVEVGMDFKKRTNVSFFLIFVGFGFSGTAFRMGMLFILGLSLEWTLGNVLTFLFF